MSGAGRPRVLVLAGHDSSGGAGVDADREAIEHHGAEAVCVVTAWTEQVPVPGGATRVRSVAARPEEEWGSDARRAISAAPPVRAIKTGLLPGAAAVRAVVRLLAEVGTLPIVVDPVLAASGGEVFCDVECRRSLLETLLPLGVVLTPNLPEAALLTGHREEDLRTDAARITAAEELLEGGAQAVLLTDGHGSGATVRDLVARRGTDPVWVERPRHPGRGLHGSGCRFAASVAALLARGTPLDEAAAAAGAWVSGRIAATGS